MRNFAQQPVARFHATHTLPPHASLPFRCQKWKNGISHNFVLGRWMARLLQVESNLGNSPYVECLPEKEKGTWDVWSGMRFRCTGPKTYRYNCFLAHSDTRVISGTRVGFSFLKNVNENYFSTFSSHNFFFFYHGGLRWDASSIPDRTLSLCRCV